MGDTVFYDSIYIFESLRPGEPKTGADLADHLAYGPHNVRVTIWRPSTKADVLERLAEVAAEARSGHHSPILHFEAHGADHGIEVSSREFIPWFELKEAMTEINTVSRLNLLVVMAACSGSNLVRIVQLTDRAPVWGVLGPVQNLTGDEIARDFRAFYDEFFIRKDGRQALERLNGAPVGAQWRYAFWPARFFFRIVFNGYLKECATPEILRQREDIIARRIVGDGVAPPDLRAALRAGLANHEAHFQNMRRLFFMIDLFPENDRRFPLTLADCERAPADDPGEPPSVEAPTTE